MRAGLFRLPSLCLLIALSSTAQAQIPVDTLIPTMARRPPTAQWVLKFAPLSLLDLTNTIQFGMEHLAKRTRGAWQGEAGYGRGTFAVLSMYGANSERQQSLETWRARAEYRLYNKRDQRWAQARYRRPHGNYVAFEGFFKQVNTHESGSMGRDCVNGQCNYNQYYQSIVETYTLGGHAKIGRQFWLSPTGDRPHWLLDMYVGLGFRTSHTARLGLPADAFVNSANTILFGSSTDNSNRTIPSVTMGLKLGFGL